MYDVYTQNIQEKFFFIFIVKCIYCFSKNITYWKMLAPLVATVSTYHIPDNTLNLPVVARQPHPDPNVADPNVASFTAARRVAGA